MLVDQSGSMRDPFGGDQTARKADFVAEVVNHTIHDLIIRCTKTEEIRNYYHLSVIGYGRSVGSCFTGPLAGRLVVPISELAEYPSRIEARIKKAPDWSGGMIEQQVRTPVWMDPVADGGTPMCQAFSLAREVVKRWLGEHGGRGFPPTVLHLTDGESSDGNPVPQGRELMSLQTDDGQVLVFNCHVSARREQKVEYPATADALPDEFARTLFEVSSKLPENFLNAARQLGVGVTDESRGFIFNADPSSVVQFYEIGTSLTGMAPHIWMDA